VLLLLTGLREKRDFLGGFVEEGIMPGGDRGRERASACESPSTDTKPDCNWCEKASVREQLIQFIFGQKRVPPVRTNPKLTSSYGSSPNICFFQVVSILQVIEGWSSRSHHWVLWSY
jgi:hypothetical protein